MFQLLKPTLILICIIAAVAGALQLIDNICKGDPGIIFILCFLFVTFIVMVCYDIYKAYRKKAQQAAKESNIVTIDNEDCLGQDKDNPKL